MEGTGKPEYDKCVAISTKAAIRQMILPGALALLTPVLVGFGLKGVFDDKYNTSSSEILGGLLAGVTVSGVLLAIFQSNAGGGIARFRVYDGVNGNPFADVNFGTPTDVIVTGNHLGSSFADITVTRVMNGQFNWFTRDTGTGAGQPGVVLGLSGSDFRLTGDYDGDGLDDYAVWRPSLNLNQSKFIVRKSTSPAVPVELVRGLDGDYPIANSRTH